MLRWSCFASILACFLVVVVVGGNVAATAAPVHTMCEHTTEHLIIINIEKKTHIYYARRASKLLMKFDSVRIEIKNSYNFVGKWTLGWLASTYAELCCHLDSNISVGRETLCVNVDFVRTVISLSLYLFLSLCVWLLCIVFSFHVISLHLRYNVTGCNGWLFSHFSCYWPSP